MNNFINIKTISELHEFFNFPSPLHPQISIFTADKIKVEISDKAEYKLDLYQISLKMGKKGSIGYGRSTYDFDDGSMTFMAPGQIFSMENVVISIDSKIFKSKTGMSPIDYRAS